MAGNDPSSQAIQRLGPQSLDLELPLSFCTNAPISHMGTFMKDTNATLSAGWRTSRGQATA